MTKSWPIDLPCLPVLGGAGIKPQDNRASFAPEVGPSIDRRRSTAAGALVAMTFRMTSAQVDSFQFFFEKILGDGVSPFLLKHPRTRNIDEWKFASDPYEIAQRGRGYDVKLNLLWMPVNRSYRSIAETKAFIASFSATPEDTFARALDDAVRQLIYEDIWGDLDVLQLYAGQNATDCVLNLKAPGSFSATIHATSTFTGYEGIAGNGSTGYVDVGFNPSTAGGVYALNSAHIGIWCKSSGQGDTYEAGLVSGSGNAFLRTRTTGDKAQGRLNDATAIEISSVASGSGHHGINRSGATARQYYIGGELAGEDMEASTSVPAVDLAAALWNSVHSTKQLAAFHAGRSMAAAKWTAMSEILADLINAASAVA